MKKLFFRFLIATFLYGFAACVIKETHPEYFSPIVCTACFVIIIAAIYIKDVSEQ
ncbi:hypothetical protein [Pantoea sp. CFSAN033090]|uniref:hypothetical protein n=1 Tax=Pantoea sp. CFSAN033090 TaxID=1690502 RepID=UPI000B0D12E2|nr:hypothetical protein [Pantoea sp. CFSAN033090]